MIYAYQAKVKPLVFSLVLSLSLWFPWESSVRELGLSADMWVFLLRQFEAIASRMRWDSGWYGSLLDSMFVCLWLCVSKTDTERERKAKVEQQCVPQHMLLERAPSGHALKKSSSTNARKWKIVIVVHVLINKICSWNSVYLLIVKQPDQLLLAESENCSCLLSTQWCVKLALQDNAM